MLNWKRAILKENLSIRQALEIIEEVGIQAGIIVDGNDILKGIMTDGDVRRGLLKGFSLESKVSEVMNPHPKSALMGTSRDEILNLMKRLQLRQLPIVDSNGKLLRIELIDDYFKQPEYSNFVVLMAGGLGKRLHPLTLDCPKPLLKIGDRPILEIILKNFIKRGFKKFFLSVFYKAEMVEDYFGDGSKWDIEIEYIKEDKQLGTVGCLRYLPSTDKPIIVMNGDLLTTVNFERLLQFHDEQRSTGTMCVRNYKHDVPFGVVNVEGNSVKSIVEKPSYNFFVNGGIYVLNPKCIHLIPPNERFDMPDLFSKLIEQGNNISAFPVQEYWLDIGRASDLEQAMGDVYQVFKDS